MSAPIKLECHGGHAIKKYKRLKPWQGRLNAMRCGLCTIDIQRNDFRWRCEEHCEYNVCEDCYNDHWMTLIEQAAGTDNPKRRFKMLDAIPDHLRATAEYEAAENYIPPEAAGPSSSEGNGKAKKMKGPKPSREETQSSSLSNCCPTWCGNVQVAFFAASYIAATILVAFSTRTLLTDKALGFPSTLLMMGLSNGISYVICQITVCILRCRHKCLGSEPDWKAANIFALMRVLQIGLGTSAMCVSESYNNAFLMFYVLTVFGAGVLNKTETFTATAFIPIVLAHAGGLMAVYQEGTYSLAGLQWGDMFLFQLLSLFIGTLRLLMMHNYLVYLPEPRFQIKISPLILSTRMMPATAIACFELACITSPGCFDTVLHVPNRGEILKLLCIIGLGNAVMLISELQILQQTSATLLGFLLPCTGIGVHILPMLLQGTTALPFFLQIGAPVYALGVALYLGRKAYASCRGADIETDADATNYQRLEGGERERHRDRPPKSSPRREKNGNNGELLESPRRPGERGGGDRRDFL